MSEEPGDDDRGVDLGEPNPDEQFEAETDQILRELGRQIGEVARKRSGGMVATAAAIGISYKHLKAMIDGANPTVRTVLQVTRALDIRSLDLRILRLTLPGRGPAALPVAEMRQRFEATIEELLARPSSDGTQSALAPPIEIPASREPLRRVRLRVEWLVSFGEPIASTAEDDVVVVPADYLDGTETLLRVSGRSMMNPCGFRDGDVIVMERRAEGQAATGENIAGLLNGKFVAGRYWNKAAVRRLERADRTPIVAIGEEDTFTILGAIQGYLPSSA